tara:strand:- start:726 stop:914 length:189 start_codon:yes stop_codon:yes gene_type:complete
MSYFKIPFHNRKMGLREATAIRPPKIRFFHILNLAYGERDVILEYKEEIINKVNVNKWKPQH